MREIKFRGFALFDDDVLNISKGEEVIGSLLVEGDNCLIKTSDREDWVIVSKSKVGQYTGLKTRDGVEVFEGDHLYDGELDYDYVVKYDEGEFRAVDESCLQCLADVLADPFVENLGFDDYSKENWNTDCECDVEAYDMNCILDNGVLKTYEEYARDHIEK